MENRYILSLNEGSCDSAKLNFQSIGHNHLYIKLATNKISSRNVNIAANQLLVYYNKAKNIVTIIIMAIFQNHGHLVNSNKKGLYIKVIFKATVTP